MSKTYESVEIELRDQVATIRINPDRPSGGFHWELGEVFTDLRGDDSIRVIVLTGMRDGVFSAGPLTSHYDSGSAKEVRNDPHRQWRIFTGIIRCHEAMAAIEKPIVARVNGDAVSFGSSLVFGSDLIVAREDARIVDNHMSMGDAAPYGPRYGIVPGDGGLGLVPLFLPPTLAKEYLMLGREFRASELAALGVINYAVPADDLDARVKELVAQLLRRPAYALAWTKRVANRRIVEHLNMTLDAAAAYEALTFLQVERQDWVDRLEL